MTPVWGWGVTVSIVHFRHHAQITTFSRFPIPVEHPAVTGA